MSPVAATLHDVVRGWLVDLLGLPGGHRRRVRHRRDGGQRRRASPPGATRCSPAWLGRPARRAVRRPAADGRGRRARPLDPVEVARARRPRPRPRASSCRPTTRVGCAPTSCPTSTGPVLVCAQAGEVNTGAFDPFADIADWVAERGGWLHVDGAFGLWALADPTRAAPRRRARPGRLVGDRRPQVAQRHLRLRHRVRPRARRPAPHVRRRRRLPAAAATGSRRCTTRRSRRSGPARSRCGRCCARSAATASAELVAGAATPPRPSPTGCAAGGLEIVNDVVLNQVLVRFGDGPTTEAAPRRGPGRRPHVVRADEWRRDRRCGSACRRGRPALDDAARPPT